jgi:hypothetical protein
VLAGCSLDAVGSPASVAPHSLQNRAVGAFAAPHEAQLRASPAPQPLQNLALWGFSVPQLEQIMRPQTLVRYAATA